MVSREYLYLALAVPILAVAACSSLNQPVSTTYAKNVEQLGITPVYPPREDIQVGDVYAVENHTTANRLTARSAFIAPTNLSKDIRAYLQSRYKFKNTDVTTSGSDVDVSRNQSDAPEGKRVTAFSDLTTLPIESFPQIGVDSGISIGVGGQPKGLAATFGLTAAKTLQMNLQFGSVTSYEVPIPVGMDRLAEYCGYETQICQNHSLATYINQRYQLAGTDKGFVKAAGVMMITKVYLARQIVYTFNDATLAAAAASVVGEDGKAGTAPMVTAATIDEVLKTENPDMVNALGTLIQALNTSVSQGGAGQGAISVAFVDKNTVSLKEIFDRPVVIGYEGVSKPGTPDPKK